MQASKLNHRVAIAFGTAALVAMTALPVQASSHREAPFVAGLPQVDGTDFYMFNSYESGREGFVTLIANYLPLQDPYGGPNYFRLDPDALYEIHVDNNGDGREDVSFQFRFNNTLRDLALNIAGKRVSVPLSNIGPIGPGAADTANSNVIESYTLNIVRGDRRHGQSQTISNASTGSKTFIKPTDNIGNKSIADYAAYAKEHIYPIAIPGCGNGRVFVGQRKESFAINLGEIFDLINTNPLGPVDGEPSDTADKNITTLALEVPTACLTAGDPVIGGWTTASLRQFRILNPKPGFGGVGAAVERGAYSQVSRLGMPLVNEVVIGLKDKDRFNASEPKDDAQFADYVTNPTLPALIEILFPIAPAPKQFPRSDLVAAFLTGVDGLNKPAKVRPSEMLRLNTVIAPVAAVNQNNLGVLGGDNAGFPNGRRPGDDVVDIELRVAMGALLPEAVAPAGKAPITDGALQNAAQFDESFPYLTTPLPGSPNTQSSTSSN